MLEEIQGLHHVTSLASDARVNNAFFTDSLGLRRIKKTVNFDAPDVYHLYYGDETGTPGAVMTYFPFPGMATGRQGAGEVGTTAFAVPRGALSYWTERLAEHGVGGLQRSDVLDEARLDFNGPDGDGFALVEVDGDTRSGWTGNGVPEEAAIRGFHSVRMRLADAGATDELLRFMGYQPAESDGELVRYRIASGNGADIVDIIAVPRAAEARQGAGSVHHVAFAVENLAAENAVREALLDTGYRVTPVIDRDYFRSIYFRSPGGVLFEVATNDPGFLRDEAVDQLGSALKLPRQHAHLRAELERHLVALDD